MNLTAAWTKFSVSRRPCSAVASLGSRCPHVPVSVISRVEVPLPVLFAFKPSARNTSVAVGSPYGCEHGDDVDIGAAWAAGFLDGMELRSDAWDAWIEKDDWIGEVESASTPSAIWSTLRISA